MDNIKDNLNQDEQTNFVLLKLQKLSSALYVITNFIHDSDPIKWKLRDMALLITSHINSGQLLLGQLIKPIEEIVSLIDIARLNHGVSQMNFDILKQEYLAVKSKINPQYGLNLENQTGTGDSSNRENVDRFSRLKEPNKSAILPKPLLNHRRDNILKLVRQQGPISIKDIVGTVSGVSGKTVQRELAELVRLGLLRKEGERRWSRYVSV